jgi:hypothetical protein
MADKNASAELRRTVALDPEVTDIVERVSRLLAEADEDRLARALATGDESLVLAELGVSADQLAALRQKLAALAISYADRFPELHDLAKAKGWGGQA